MGRSKALLPHPDTGGTFLRHLVDVYQAGGVDQVFVVTRPGDATLTGEATGAGAITVVNPDPDRGQLSSILAGLEAVETLGARGVLVTPVDLPLLSAGVVRAVLAASASGAVIARPIHGGRGGHPVYFAAEVFPELRAADPAEGARAVVRAHRPRVVDVAVDEIGVITDVDTPDDYRRLIDYASTSR